MEWWSNAKICFLDMFLCEAIDFLLGQLVPRKQSEVAGVGRTISSADICERLWFILMSIRCNYAEFNA